jgi:hypothetical protein
MRLLQALDADRAVVTAGAAVRSDTRTVGVARALYTSVPAAGRRRRPGAIRGTGALHALLRRRVAETSRIWTVRRRLAADARPRGLAADRSIAILALLIVHAGRVACVVRQPTHRSAARVTIVVRPALDAGPAEAERACRRTLRRAGAIHTTERWIALLIRRARGDTVGSANGASALGTGRSAGARVRAGARVGCAARGAAAPFAAAAPACRGGAASGSVASVTLAGAGAAVTAAGLPRARQINAASCDGARRDHHGTGRSRMGDAHRDSPLCGRLCAPSVPTSVLG